MEPLKGQYVNLFCSRSCSASWNNQNRVRSEESKAKVSKSLSGRIRDVRPPKDPVTYITRKTCVVCSKQFWAAGEYRKRIKTCGSECASTNRSMNKTRKVHIPFVEPETGRTIDLQSSWEKIIAEKLNELNLRWSRPSKRFTWNDGIAQRTYLPDFYLPDFDLYLDVKNQVGIAQQKQKIQEVSKQINLVVSELKPMVEYLEALSRLELDLRRSKRPV